MAEPAKPPLEAHVTQPAEGAGNNLAQQGAPAISSEAPKSDIAPAEAAPAEVLANGSEPGAGAPREPPTMTGALQDGTVPTARSPSPANLPAVAAVGAPVITDAPAAAAVAPEPAAAEKANGELPRPAESVEEKPPAPAAEEPAVQQPGDKRKAEDASPTNGDAAAGKKAKTDEVAERGAATNGANGAGPKKSGRPKKNKEAAPPAGRTARKTRSQGPADA